MRQIKNKEKAERRVQPSQLDSRGASPTFSSLHFFASLVKIPQIIQVSPRPNKTFKSTDNILDSCPLKTTRAERDQERPARGPSGCGMAVESLRTHIQAQINLHTHTYTHISGDIYTQVMISVGSI